MDPDQFLVIASILNNCICEDRVHFMVVSPQQCVVQKGVLLRKVFEIVK